ncbi:MAG: hypothetical protein IJO06_01650 [Thermoguttaceae bacterium]|nr:hypothetical protein [Thermoguttaceae bacterium]
MTDITTFHDDNTRAFPLFGQAFTAAVDALEYGKSRVNRVENIETVLGAQTQNFRYDATSLTVEFANGRFLRLRVADGRLQGEVFASRPARQAPNVEALRVVYDDGAVDWTSDFFDKYVGKTFKRVHLERGVVWLYFENAETLLTGVAMHVAERKTPILKLSDED